MPEPPTASDYNGLRKLVDERRIELRMKMWEVDVDAELQDGYFAKIICGLRNFGPDTLGKILGALGVQIVLQPSSVGSSSRKDLFLSDRLKALGATGGRVARSRYTDEEWKRHCRRAGRKSAAKRLGKLKPVRKHGNTKQKKLQNAQNARQPNKGTVAGGV